MQEQARQAPVLADAHIRAGEDGRRQWDEVTRTITFRAQQLGVAISQALGVIDTRSELGRLRDELLAVRTQFELAERQFQIMRARGREDQQVIDNQLRVANMCSAFLQGALGIDVKGGGINVDDQVD